MDPLPWNSTTQGAAGITPFNVVETHAVALDELADRRVPAFRQLGEDNVTDDEKNYKQHRDE